ncbi:CD209 antigen-like protein C isoform X2 [Hemibagrus wyckioides]|uniref:CD209 antigen-like protein C isoform X2 n=1 Tax=Hemibagrus wyckioides TaxID=337641 RepID=UPI00266D273C|nr:CD209 antigen-like protein C isoform X2 [Hemibagrus wyckioides]
MEMMENDADSENIYLNEDDAEKTSNQSGIYDSIYLNTTTETLGSAGACGRRKVKWIDVAAVSLGILCLLLLAAIIVLCVKYNTELHQVQSHDENMTAERDGLQSTYNLLYMEKELLMNLNNNLTTERDRLQSSYDKLRSESQAMQKCLTRTEECCPNGWLSFLSSCYLISTVKGTWEESRQACRNTGADLVIINSREEQFVSGHGMNLWIGLTDRDWEGQWKWVDNTALEIGYWGRNEPNNGWYGFVKEDCAEVVSNSPETSNWNDVKCSDALNSLCEKKIFDPSPNNRKTLFNKRV